ncbi:MAG: tripartite tricarboxylate transporter substrate binding protein [Alcaligenaceae bacterium]|nr:MAG: tripartite tricarboxylate transporter substrate binding protein [Alcaligenaceae bacterium]
MKRYFSHAALGLGALLSAACTWAAYPDKPIALVVPFPAGATTDTIARILADGMSQELGTSVIVENKPGAEGQIAAQDVARAQPDGYRITLATSGNLSVLPALRKTPPFDVMRDFTPIADVGRYAFFLYVNRDVPAKSVGEFVSYAKGQSGKLNYGTGNNTGVLTFASLAAAAGLKLSHVPYKGEPPAMVDLVSGNIQAMIGTAIGMPHVKDGKLRVLATLLPQRSALAPDVPTMAEAGVKNLDAIAWAGVVGPANMPPAVVERLNAAINATLIKPDVIKKMEPIGFALTPSSSADFKKLMQTQLDVYADLVKKSGMEPQ